MTVGTLVLVWAAGIAQLAHDPAEPYELVLRNSNSRMYVRVDPREFERPTGRIQVELDEPWLPASERIRTIRLSEITSYELQRPTVRDTRIENGWLRIGGIQIDTATGRRWILRAEYELAQRAQGMADALDEEGPAASSIETSEAEGTDGGAGLLQWWRHVLIGAVALTLGALVVRRFFFW